MRLTVILNMVLLLAAEPCFAQTWLPVGAGIECGNGYYVRDFSTSEDGSHLYIAGFFNRDGNCNPMRAVLTYDGIQFQQAAQPLNGSESLLAFEYNGNIYSEGYFVPQTGSYPLYFNIKTEEGIWDTVPNGLSGGAYDYQIRDGVVYLAGGFSTCNGVPCRLVCTFDGEQVQPYYMGTDTFASNAAYTLEFYKDTLYVGGIFVGTDGLQYQGYNDCCKIVNGQLEKVAQGFPISGVFYDLEVYDDKLYMGGWAPTFGSSEWHTIYYYEAGQLHTLPSEPDFTVSAIKAYNGGLYVAGDFSNIGEMPCNRIARWDGQEWTCLSDDVFYYQDGVTCSVDCIRDIEIWNDTLYIGGRFHRIGEDTLKRIAKLDMALSQAFPVSITEQQRQELKLNVYPNPAKDELNIQLSSPSDVFIYTATGQLMETHTAKSNYHIDVSHYPAGLYLVVSGGEQRRFVRE